MMERLGLGPNSPRTDDRPLEVRGLEIQNKLGDRIPLELTFTTPEGKTVKLAEYFNRPSAAGSFNKPVVLMMVYYKCPILCPMVLDKFTDTLNQLDFTAGSEFDALVISFDGRDKPVDALTRRGGQLLYYKQPTTDAIRSGFNFLTCETRPENARTLADALGFPYRYFPERGEFSHGAAVFVLTPEGKISRYLLGLNYKSKDVRLALLEASQGRIGNLFDAFTLWCYHYDPASGSYALLAMRVMRVGGGLTALLLGALIFALFRWERRKRRLAPAGSPAPALTVPPHPSLTHSGFAR
jgi:protein SCO1/2